VDITRRKEAEEALKEGEDRHRRQLGELALLHGVRTALAQELDLRRVLRGTVEAVAKTYGYTQVGAYLLEGADLVLQHLVGYEHVIERFPVTKGVCGCAAASGPRTLWPASAAMSSSCSWKTWKAPKTPSGWRSGSRSGDPSWWMAGICSSP